MLKSECSLHPIAIGSGLFAMGSSTEVDTRAMVRVATNHFSLNLAGFQNLRGLLQFEFTFNKLTHVTLLIVGLWIL